MGLFSLTQDFAWWPHINAWSILKRTVSTVCECRKRYAARHLDIGISPRPQRQLWGSVTSCVGFAADLRGGRDSNPMSMYKLFR